MACPQPETEQPAGSIPSNRRKRRRAPAKATARHLENVALWYLARFQASARSLERVLERRVLRSARHHGTDAGEGRALIAELIARYRRAGLLDDAAYAQARALALHRRGISARAIRARLAEKGIAGQEIDAAIHGLGGVTGSDASPDLEAAKRTARRRRLGPWRDARQRAARREKDLAALARAGFAYAVAKEVIDGEP